MAKQVKAKRDIHQEITNNLIEIMDKGTLPWRKDWNGRGTVDLGMPNNPFTGSNYNGINILLLWGTASNRGYSSNSWGTFNQIQKAGGMVRKGEKGTTVVLFKPLIKKGKPGDSGEAGENEIIPLMRHFTVFNLVQCDSVTIPKQKVIPEVDRIENAEKYIAGTDSNIIFGGDRACYMPGRDSIQMPQAGTFKSIQGYYATMLHEHIHWTGSKDRLDRLTKCGFGSHDYAFEELVAELGAAFSCAALGIESDIENHASYLANWLEKLREDKRYIFRAAAKASKAVKFLNELQTESEAVAA